MCIPSLVCVNPQTIFVFAQGLSILIKFASTGAARGFWLRLAVQSRTRPPHVFGNNASGDVDGLRVVHHHVESDLRPGCRCRCGSIILLVATPLPQRAAQNGN
jgi:hypothetical protein